MKKKTKGEGKLTSVQRFVVERIHRRQIKNAPYNPRQIDDHARKKLKENLKAVGLLDPLVWNKSTSNLVSGHQRLSIIDALEGTDDYTMDVAVVELTGKVEKEQNVFFNNPSAQGTYDVDGLGKMLTEDKVDYKKAGFDDMDLQLIFEDTDYVVSMFDTDDAPKSVKDDLEQLKEIQRMKRERKEHRERDQEANDPEFYAVVVFPDRAAQGQFMERVGMNRNDRYVDGVRLHTSLEATKPQTKTKGGEQFEALTFWIAPDQKKVIEDELVRISSLLKGKNLRGRALEAMAAISSQTDIDNITGEEPEEEKPAFKRKKGKVS
jgi:hypothetical protein